jgi:hypothetical protein
MPDIGPAIGIEPAARTALQAAPNNTRRTGISSQFRGLLGDPSVGAFPAQGPVVVHCLAAPPESAVKNGLEGPHAHLRRRPGSISEDDDAPSAESPRAALDPLLCQMAFHPGITLGLAEAQGAQAATFAPVFREDLQNLINGLARRVAWGGDRRKGSARIELSEGALAGATLTVHTDQRHVRVELDLPSGGSLASDWQQRILDRLAKRGFSAHVQVR